MVESGDVSFHGLLAAQDSTCSHVNLTSMSYRSTQFYIDTLLFPIQISGNFWAPKQGIL